MNKEEGANMIEEPGHSEEQTAASEQRGHSGSRGKGFKGFVFKQTASCSSRRKVGRGDPPPVMDPLEAPLPWNMG